MEAARRAGNDSLSGAARNRSNTGGKYHGTYRIKTSGKKSAPKRNTFQTAVSEAETKVSRPRGADATSPRPRGAKLPGAGKIDGQNGADHGRRQRHWPRGGDCFCAGRGEYRCLLLAGRRGGREGNQALG